MKSKKKIIKTRLISCLLAACLLASPVWAAAGVEEQADTIFKQMSSYLAGLKKFDVVSQSSIETMLDSGQKIMLDHSNVTSVQRPDRLFTTRNGDLVKQSFYYDGKTFTYFDEDAGEYTVTPAPPTLAEALDQAVKGFDVTAPGADLLYPNSYERLSKGLIDGFYVGKSSIYGVECHHLAFRNGDVDWQIWIQTGDKPRPIKYVITSRWITGAPQFTVVMQWNESPDFAEDLFTFVPPAGAKEKKTEK